MILTFSDEQLSLAIDIMVRCSHALNLYMPCAKAPRHTDILTENRSCFKLVLITKEWIDFNAFHLLSIWSSKKTQS